MQSGFSAIDALSVSKARVHFNLGTIGHLESRHVGALGPWALPTQDFHVALADASPGLPRPGRDLDGILLRAPAKTPLLLLAATHHNVAYYVICNLAEQAAWRALNWANQVGRLEFGFISEDGIPLWSAIHLDDSVRQRLSWALAAHKSRVPKPDDSWRDQLGLLLLNLPSLLAEAAPNASQCALHCAVLLSGSKSAHAGRVARCLARA